MARPSDIQSIFMELEIIKTRLEEKENALKMQAKEYERRLVELNHAYERSEQILTRHDAMYLPIATHETFKEGYQQWRSDVDKNLASKAGGSAMLAAIISTLISVLAFTASIIPVLMK